MAKTAVHLIEIQKYEYELINKAQVVTGNREKFLFIQELALFKKVFKFSLEGFVYYMNPVTCMYNRTLYSEDSPINMVYIIVEGEFKLQRTINKRRGISAIKNRKSAAKYRQGEETYKNRSLKLNTEP